ncbi:hypothetical protein HY230_10785 [Candidatus Acetothermia bacterium]|nr:hypothetical protein [Candidatus Acetothermia bacterium]
MQLGKMILLFSLVTLAMVIVVATVHAAPPNSSAVLASAKNLLGQLSKLETQFSAYQTAYAKLAENTVDGEMDDIKNALNTILACDDTVLGEISQCIKKAQALVRSALRKANLFIAMTQRTQVFVNSFARGLISLNRQVGSFPTKNASLVINDCDGPILNIQGLLLAARANLTTTRALTSNALRLLIVITRDAFVALAGSAQQVFAQAKFAINEMQRIQTDQLGFCAVALTKLIDELKAFLLNSSILLTTPVLSESSENLSVMTLNNVALRAHAESLANGIYFIVKSYSDGRREVTKLVIMR